MKTKKYKLIALVINKTTTKSNKLLKNSRQQLLFQYLRSFIVKRNSRLTFSFKDVLKNKKKNIEQLNYDKLQYDLTRNEHFTMIERPGPSKHLSTLKDCCQCQQILQILYLDITKNQNDRFSRNISRSFRLQITTSQEEFPRSYRGKCLDSDQNQYKVLLKVNS